MGDPVLLQVAKPVERFDTPELHALLTDMQDTMTALNGAGIAAPQIGVSQQVVIFGVGKNPRYPQAEEVPYTVLINPELEPLSDEMEDGWEGCLSVPGMRGLVPRYTRLRYRGFDQYGNATCWACSIRCGSATCATLDSTRRCFPGRRFRTTNGGPCDPRVAQRRHDSLRLLIRSDP
jgi:peptide deformylase